VAGQDGEYSGEDPLAPIPVNVSEKLIRHSIKEKRERDLEEAKKASSTKRFCFVLSVPGPSI
jgi:hypothetical protein